MITITASVVTLGCRLNQADSALLCDRLRRCGFQIVDEDYEESPNLVIVNSCTVTATAARKTRQLLTSIRHKHPYAYIILTGCAAEVDEELKEDSDFDILLTKAEKKNLESILERRFNIQHHDYKPSETVDETVFKEDAVAYFPFKSRANLKIQEGCNNFCTYCIVPYARGRERSRDVEEIMADFKQLLEAGFHEIVITGVNVCNYNCGGLDLVGLLEKLIAVEGDFRIRLGSTEPGEILPRVIDLMASTPKICDFLHLPLQAGTDEILKAMGRKYTLAEYKSMIDCARSKMPHIHIGSDLIVGFPGETAELFEQSCEFVKSMHFANLHVFPFSPRKGTKAEKLPGRIPVEEMVRRVEATKPIKAACAAEFAKSLIGTELSVLFERTLANNGYEGWSSNYVKVRTRSPKSILKEIHTVKVNAGNDENILSGKLMN
ncbi:MAG: tRNA (N(6)-L-threonylcarbamoyladenosine(37)-C(2))-methylthiotransferase MtaB [Victivallales bacterium]|jgi:threonylcarbamoyladenosine tRNA methylthiotransferase MtaB|nr:tRNA (N(6)-L-threonylcarbamoyladenosine(37)-C(2))-methylthiotransferase MtaB [Lentisphaeria bacterium]HCG50824.1 tRNA (N(6)-L-threonylcarbamoyladenosine(37)-C(2))-methylthiotransferase MtaB [Lentisphaeria bacterium]